MAAKKRQELTNLALAKRLQTRVNKEQRKGQSRRTKPLGKHKNQIEQNHILAKKLEKESKINPRFRNFAEGAIRTKPSYDTTLHI
jgi:hypothetical protein